MPIETFGFIDDLDVSLPGATDGPSQGDDHIRGIKTTLQNQFPNLDEAVTATADDINQLDAGVIGFAAGTSGAPSVGFADEPTLGFYRSAAGVISVAGGQLAGNGLMPPGAIVDFLNEPPTGWYELNGQAISRTGVGAALFALYGTFYGAGNLTTTFNLPDLGQRYRRARGGALSAGATQADAIKSFTAPVTGSTAAHGHGNNFSVGGVSYTLPQGIVGQAQTPTFSGGNFWFGNGGVGSQTPSFSGGVSDAAALSLSGTATYTGSTETRPLTMIVVTCVKA